MSAAISLPMYALPAMRAANAALWATIAAVVRRDFDLDLPDTLGTDDGPTPGRSFRDILFSQTCGYPMQTILRGQLQLLATPSYDAPGCGVMTHCAFIAVREGDPARAPADLRGRRFARNADHSNSGMNLPRRLFAPLARDGRFFGEIVDTGSHAASLVALQQGEADAASIDCVTWAFAGDYAPELLRGLRVLAETPASPALPFVTGTNTPPDVTAALRSALLTIGTAPAYADVRRPLRLASIGSPAEDVYATVLRHQQAAADAGYPDLA